MPVSYLVYRLTGEHVVDHANASTSMLYNLHDRDYDPELLELFGIRPDELPAVRSADRLAAPLSPSGADLTGLPAGLPVAVGSGDDFISTLGAGVLRPGIVTCVLGTSEVVGALHDTPVLDCTGLVETHPFFGGRYFIENPGWLSGGVLNWFKDIFQLADFSALDREADRSPVGASGVAFLPGFSGTMAPEWIASARGCFYGLTPACTVSALARSVLEGLAFPMRDVVDRLQTMSIAADEIMLLGGGAKSTVWAQMRADLTGIPVRVPVRTDTAPLGSAALGLVAAGIRANVGQALESLIPDGRIFDPDPVRSDAYEDAYRAYRELFKSLKPMFSRA